MYTLWPQRHLAKFCFDKMHHINFAKKNVWVPLDANPRGPKRQWVPKSPPFVFDVGVGSHKTWESWCHSGGCMDLMDIHLIHRYQGGLVGRPPCFGDLEYNSYGLVTISKLLFWFTCFYNWWFLACFSFIIMLYVLCGKYLFRCSFCQNLCIYVYK